MKEARVTKLACVMLTVTCCCWSLHHQMREVSGGGALADILPGACSLKAGECTEVN
jgi:hypothetical protein